MLYGFKQKDVNEVRFKLFETKYEKQSKVIDLSTLPPCQSVLKLHANRANFVSKMFKSSLVAQMQIPDITAHGWDEKGNIIWLNKEFPDNIEELVIDPAYDEDETDILGSDDMSDNDDHDVNTHY